MSRSRSHARCRKSLARRRVVFWRSRTRSTACLFLSSTSLPRDSVGKSIPSANLIPTTELFGVARRAGVVFPNLDERYMHACVVHLGREILEDHPRDVLGRG